MVGTTDTSIQLKKYAETTLANDFGVDDAEFLRIDSAIYLSDGKVLKRLSINEATHAIDQHTVDGFVPLG